LIRIYPGQKLNWIKSEQLLSTTIDKKSESIEFGFLFPTMGRSLQGQHLVTREIKRKLISSTAKS